MTRKNLRETLLLMCYMLKKNIYAASITKHNLNHKKINHSFTDSKQKDDIICQ